MPTPGFEPLTVLWNLFYQFPQPWQSQGWPSITEENRTDIKRIIDRATDRRTNMKGETLVEAFKHQMTDENRAKLTLEHEALAAGLLECVDPYQAVLTWTDPKAVYFTLGRIWDHFKGGVYLKTGVASWSSGQGEPVVQYTSLLFGTDHVKLVSDWCEVVKWPDGKYRSRYVHRRGDDTTRPPSYKVPSPVA